MHKLKHNKGVYLSASGINHYIITCPFCGVVTKDKFVCPNCKAVHKLDGFSYRRGIVRVRDRPLIVM